MDARGIRARDAREDPMGGIVVDVDKRRMIQDYIAAPP